MKKIFLFVLLSVSFYIGNAQENNSSATMVDRYRKPQIEEGINNIILQNRCGNRLTLLIFNDHTDLEFVYKPNASRRKDFRARNFSSRDNFTTLFSSFSFPQVQSDYIKKFNYDPFNTSLETQTPWDAKNKISVINIADENVFAIAAHAPLMLSFKPKKAFVEKNGLFIENFNERGENIISFISFPGFEQNRFRVTQDGSYIIQLMENEVILVGGEDSEYQADRVLNKFRGLDLQSLITTNEKLLTEIASKGKIIFNNTDMQKVIDINKRVVYSGIDEGGACFGALNRIYHLIWVRDGSMTTSLMARAGNPDLIKIWAPFLLNNPSIRVREDGTKVPEFLQIVGTRWTKSEDDGIFYAILSLYTYFQTTGQDNLIQGKEFPLVLDAIDRFLEKTWKPDQGMIISNTIGETPLKGDPYFGFDVVNGDFEKNGDHLYNGKSIELCASLYNQVNTYNIMLMASILLEQRPELNTNRTSNYLKIAQQLKQTINSKYVSPEGVYYEDYYIFSDGTNAFKPVGTNPWEYSWAQSIGPFYPDLNLSLKSAQYTYKKWGAQNRYGYCPWNTLSNKLFEFGMTTSEYETMLAPEMSEALMVTKKYPMPGALTEYKTDIESWRALPFSAGSFFYSINGMMLQTLPMGLAVRTSDKADKMDNFCYRLSRFNITATGKGDVVSSYKLNGTEFKGTLQIPTSYMKAGVNTIEVIRGKENNEVRLFSSTSELINYTESSNTYSYSINSPIKTEAIFENIEKAKEIKIIGLDGNNISFTKTAIQGTNKTMIQFEKTGEVNITVVK